jgi:hypothetical protein
MVVMINEHVVISLRKAGLSEPTTVRLPAGNVGILMSFVQLSPGRSMSFVQPATEAANDSDFIPRRPTRQLVTVLIRSRD